ncbi:MAG TPA: TonB-dependent receptor [Chitinophagaceae bacterium]|nr:TonB-dependent receptor [Chitinophagaceae bacterium]
MKRNIFVLAALIFSSRLLAQVSGDSVILTLDEFPSTELNRVIVTALKTEQRLSTTGKVVNIITRFDLEQNSGKTISELLNSVSGISINGANNNLGTNQTVNIRGASAGNALILIDGVPVNDPSVITNYFDLNLLAPEQVERIEILKGGQSTLYGSDAVAGVINIITRRHSNKKISLNASLNAGSYNTYKSNIGLSGKSGKVHYNFLYNYIHSDGFSSAYDSAKNNNFDKDGFSENVLYAGLQWQITKALSGKIHGRFSNYNTDVDAAGFTDDKDFTSSSKNFQGGVTLAYQLNNGNINASYLYNTVTRKYVDDSTDRSNFYAYYSDAKYDGITHFAEIFTTQKWDNIELLAGIDFRNNKTNQDYFSFGPFGGYTSSLKDTLAKMWQLSPYATAVLKNNEGLLIETGLRWNYHSEYGSNLTWSFNPAYLVNNRLKLFANIYSSFKAPTLYQLFDEFSGNKDLKPEKSILFESGIQYVPNSSFSSRIVYFKRNTKDAIQFLLDDPVFYAYKYKNINRLKNTGIETEAKYKAGRWQFDINYTYVTGKTTSGFDETGSPLSKDTTYNNLYRIPKNTFTFSVSAYPSKKVFIRTMIKAIGKRYEPVYGTSPEILDSYYTVDLYGDYEFSKKIKAFIDLRNLSNQKYFDLLGYNSRRFNFMTGVLIKLEK